MIPKRPAPDHTQQRHVDHSWCPRCSQQGEVQTWVNSQWKISATPGQISMEINNERIRTSAPTWRGLDRGWPVILLEAIGCGCADRRLRGRDRRAVCLAECHVEPHLLIGDVTAGQWADPFTRRSIQSSSRSRSTDGPRSSRKHRPSRLTLAPPVGLRSPCAASVRRLSHLDCRTFSS